MSDEPTWMIAGSENELAKYAPKHLRTNLPEQHGCDVLVFNKQPTVNCVGFQRKEVHDFIASLHDGRLVKEIGQIKASNLLGFAFLIIEGQFIWTTDGSLATSYGNPFSRRQYHSIITGIQLQGIGCHYSLHPFDTISLISDVSQYLSKGAHSSLTRRPKSDLRNSWGRVTNEQFAVHLLQSFPGIGPNTAEAIFKKFGSAPLQWTVSESELVSIPGIGNATAKRLIEALEANIGE